MMHAGRGLRSATALVWLVGCGCTTLREIPRAEYAAQQERRHVTVVTQEGTRHEFDVAHIDGDTLTGLRRRDVQGPVEEYESVPIPLESVARLSARRLDWYRMGLIGGGALVALALAALARGGDEGPRPGPVPLPCVDEPCR